jgi:hypothetical protein
MQYLKATGFAYSKTHSERASERREEKAKTTFFASCLHHYLIENKKGRRTKEKLFLFLHNVSERST